MPDVASVSALPTYDDSLQPPGHCLTLVPGHPEPTACDDRGRRARRGGSLPDCVLARAEALGKRSRILGHAGSVRAAEARPIVRGKKLGRDKKSQETPKRYRL